MKACVTSLALIAVTACATTSTDVAPRVTSDDLALVDGAGWTGTLVYRDYSPPYGDVTLQAEVDVSVTSDGLLLDMRYPGEPSANSTDMLSVATDGSRLGGDPVVARKEEQGEVRITTRAPCEDDDKPAICEHIYTFSKARFGLRKTVKFDGSSDTFQRNAYTFTR